MKTLEVHFLMIQFSIIIVLSFQVIASDMPQRFQNAVQIVVAAQLSPKPSLSIDFGDVSETNAPDNT